MYALISNAKMMPLTIVLCSTCFWIFAEQNLLAPSMTAIAKDFHMTDLEKDEKLGGEVSLGFFIIGGVVGLAVGWAVDNATHFISRTKLFALVVLCGRLGSLGTYLCHSYSLFLISRIFTGISIGGASPIVFSILGEVFSASSRVHIASLVGLSMSFGGAFGQVMAAYLAPKFGWRAPFLLSAIPGMICVGALLCISDAKSPSEIEEEEVVHEHDIDASVTLLEGGGEDAGSASSQPTALHPEMYTYESGLDADMLDVSRVPLQSPSIKTRAKRAMEALQVDKETENPVGAISTSSATTRCNSFPGLQSVLIRVIDVLSIPTAALVLLQGIFGCIPWAIISVFLNDFLQHDLRLDVHTATLLLTFFGAGAAVGQLGGGILGQRLLNRDPRLQVIYMGISGALATIPLLLVLNHGDFVPKVHHHLRDSVDPEHPFGGFHEGGDSAEPGPSSSIYFLFALTGLLAAAVGPNVRSVLQNVTTSSNRGMAFALYVLCDDVGRGGGPYLVARLIAWTGSRKEAFDIGILNWVLSGLLSVYMYRFVVKDMQHSSAPLKRKLFIE